MLAKLPRPGRLTALAVVLGVAALVALVWGWRALHSDPEQLIGIPLPASASHLQLDIRRRFPGEYEGYLRFELAPDDVPALLAHSALQPATISTDPLAQIATAQRGNTSLATLARQEQPDWWNLGQGPPYLLAYRSRVERGPDAVWFAIDTSDPAQAIVYVYIVEV